MSTAGDDYSVQPSDLSFTVPAGPPTELCIPVSIVNDNIALEPNETLTFNFDMTDPRVVPQNPDQAVVTIVDDDRGKEVSYV